MAETPPAPAVEPASAPPPPAPTPPTTGGANGAPSTSTRRRGRRGGARRGGAAAAAAAAAAALEEAPKPVEAEKPPEKPPARGARATAVTTTAPAPGGGRRRSEPTLPAGSVESLVARQNVLFEEFATQQTQVLREIQRAVGNISKAGGVTPAILPKTAIFLDVPNLIYAAEQMGVRVHFGKLLDYLTQNRELVRATAYAPITDDPTTRFEQQRFVAPVLGHGYKVVTKAWKRFADGGMKANFDIELAVDILTMSDRLDIVVLMSGDGDFRRVVELVESKGVRVEVVAFASSTAMELRAVADSYIDLGSILGIVGA